MDYDLAKRIISTLRGLDPLVGEAMHLIDSIDDEAERESFNSAIGNILFAQNDLMRMIIRQHRDLEEDFARLDDD